MENSTWIIVAIAIAGAFSLLFAAVLWMVRRWISHQSLQKHHDVAGFMLGTIGVLYSVILGFTVINTKDRYDQAANTLHTEAMMLADLYRAASFFPPENSALLRSQIRNYVHYVLDEEWQAKGNHLLAARAVQQLWDSFKGVDLSSEMSKIWYAESISKLDDLMNARLARQFYAKERLGSMMWALLIIGAIITVSFLLFFGLESLFNQIVMTCLLVSYLSFMLYLVYCLDNPFTGSLGIKPTAIEQSISVFDEIDR